MVLSDRTIREEIAKGRIVIDPLGDGCIQPASVDVHLDRRVLVFRNSRRPFIDVREDMSDLTEMVEIDDDQPFMLHPGRVRPGQHARAHRAAGRPGRAAGGEELAGPHRTADPLHRRVRRPRMEGQPHPRAEQRRQSARHPVPRDEDRTALLSAAVHPRREPVRLPCLGQQVPGPDRADREPYLPGLRERSQARLNEPHGSGSDAGSQGAGLGEPQSPRSARWS